ncbi:MAG: Com family DNA-binding transcriptional regulator [Oscillospiraceae bacterium]|nr:Com family DNA-binding transcriptional regulator [Oscillospiraceae bacterium]
MDKKCESNINPAKIAVRCSQCKRIVGYKIMAGTGRIQIKCPKCGTEMVIDLSMRRSNKRLFYRLSVPLQ